MKEGQCRYVCDGVADADEDDNGVVGIQIQEVA